MSSELLFSFKNVSSSLAVQGTGEQPRTSSAESIRVVQTPGHARCGGLGLYP